MNHMTRQMIQLIGVVMLLHLWPAGDADAVFESALRGEYDVNITLSCTIDGVRIESPPGCGTFFFTGNPLQSIAVRGVSSFDGAGNAGFTGQFFFNQPTVAFTNSTTDVSGVPTGVGTEFRVIQADFTSCSGTYTVNGDGTFTETLNCNLTFTQGLNTGDAATLSGFTVRGKLAHDGTIIVLGSTSATTADFETLNCPTCNGSGGQQDAGFTQRRLCSSVGTATSRR